MEEIKKSFKHIVFTRFDVHSASQLDPDWLEYRLEIFKKYTVESLLNQDVKNFALWVRYAPDFFEEAKEFNKYLKTLPFPVFFTTFKHGVDYQTEELYDYVKDVDVVIETRIDSDDMYHKTALSEIQEQNFDETDIFIFQDAYVYREDTKQLYHYKGSCAPFYTCVYPREVFIDQKKKKELYPWIPDVSKSTRKKLLSDDKYLVIAHQKNSTNYSEKWIREAHLLSGALSTVTKKHEIGKDKEEILKGFKQTWNN